MLTGIDGLRAGTEDMHAQRSVLVIHFSVFFRLH